MILQVEICGCWWLGLMMIAKKGKIFLNYYILQINLRGFMVFHKITIQLGVIWIFKYVH